MVRTFPAMLDIPRIRRCRSMRMPGKEEKSQYPSCNRAFALRMMNPNSYRQGQVSPLDREIQPVLKRPVARSVSSRSDDSPIPSSADTSYQDMELYDIDENGMVHGKNIPLSASFDSVMRPKGDKFPTSPRKHHDEFGMRRSLSSVDGFNSNALKRTSPARTTMPARIRTKGQKDSDSPTHTAIKGKIPNGQPVSNGKESSAQTKRHNGTSGKVNSAAPAMKGKPRVDPPPEGRPRTPVSLSKVVRVPGTRSSELRAKSRLEGEMKNDVVLLSNEIDGKNQKVKRLNGHINGIMKNGKDDEVSDTSSEHSIETALKLSSPVSHSAAQPPNLCCSPTSYELPPSDEFSTKLAEVCNIITEKHPGDFQILETLVTMQTAYEDRDKQVTKVILNLRERINDLEEKLRNSPNIPSLVIPLLRASNSFQKQLHNIFVSHKETLGKVGSSNGPISPNMNGYSRSNPFDEIYMEANSVAEHILSRSQNSRRKSLDESQGHDTAEQILSRQYSRQKSNDESIKNELINGHMDANSVAEKILSRQNSLRKSNNGSRRNSSEQSLSRSNSQRRPNDENQQQNGSENGSVSRNSSFTKVNGHTNGHTNGHVNGHVNGDLYSEKPDILVNGCSSRVFENGNYDSYNDERLV